MTMVWPFSVSPPLLSLHPTTIHAEQQQEHLTTSNQLIQYNMVAVSTQCKCTDKTLVDNLTPQPCSASSSLQLCKMCAAHGRAIGGYRYVEDEVSKVLWSILLIRKLFYLLEEEHDSAWLSNKGHTQEGRAFAKRCQLNRRVRKNNWFLCKNLALWWTPKQWATADLSNDATPCKQISFSNQQTILNDVLIDRHMYCWMWKAVGVA